MYKIKKFFDMFCAIQKIIFYFAGYVWFFIWLKFYKVFLKWMSIDKNVEGIFFFDLIGY